MLTGFHLIPPQIWNKKLIKPKGTVFPLVSAVTKVGNGDGSVLLMLEALLILFSPFSMTAKRAA